VYLLGGGWAREVGGSVVGVCLGGVVCVQRGLGCRSVGLRAGGEGGGRGAVGCEGGFAWGSGGVGGVGGVGGEALQQSPRTGVWPEVTVVGPSPHQKRGLGWHAGVERTSRRLSPRDIVWCWVRVWVWAGVFGVLWGVQGVGCCVGGGVCGLW